MKTENLDDYKSAYFQKHQFYDENQWFLNQYALYISETIRSKSVKSILSLGIGHQFVSDRIISLLQNKTLSEYAIVEGSKDIIEDFLKRNSKKNIELHHSYFEKFDTKKRYDAIEMGFVLEHVDDPVLVINRFKKFLKDDGVLFISVPNARSLHRLIGEKAGSLDSLYKLSSYDLELGHKRYFDLSTIKESITSCNLKVTVEKGLMLKPITGQQIKTLKWDKSIINALMEIGEHYPDISNCIYLEAELQS